LHRGSSFFQCDVSNLLSSFSACELDKCLDISTIGYGRGRGRHGRDDRGRNTANARARTAASTFKGNTPDMIGHVFQCHSEAANTSQFLKTVEALSEYINKNLSFPKDLASLCESHDATPVIKEPLGIGVLFFADGFLSPVERRDAVFLRKPDFFL
jgi:hypothetical protein